ncbi:auxin-responsive protein IAA29-like [Lycium ferocissimum]|uniref:auxin-responsive protein IAA29-like n=1 Tax=Lycium ferocissimum TaxID=112874 RepID=UPI0028156C10|nr:auxin-responsive protein IAA29-like [Lycium ferocissimum]
MELELGLALPCNHFPTNIKGFNQNGNAGFDDMMMRRKNSFVDNFSELKQKRGSGEAFQESNGGVLECKTLSLFIWNGQPNEEEEDNNDDHHGRKKRPFKACDKDFEEENQVVGWPPIDTWRKKQLQGNYHQGGWITNYRNNIVGGRNSMYVKVKMEGVAIGREVDLSLDDSYQLLIHNLLQMFPKYQNRGNNSTRFAILYQDREGDWMLAGDVPRKTFVETVKRIEIKKNEK